MEMKYPGVALRVKAVIADTFVLMALMIGITFMFSQFESVADHFRVAAFLFVFLLYDPLLTSLFGGTVGHKMNGICVKRSSNQERNLILPLTLIRFLVKTTLGWVSLLTVSGHSERKAIHDLITGSVVLYEQGKLEIQ